MNRIDDLKKRIKIELDGYSVYFTPESVPADVNFPVAWKNFGFVDGRNSRIPDAWGSFAGNLPWVTSWLDKCVLGTFLAVSDKAYLVYAYCEDGELNFYLGGVPVKGDDVFCEAVNFLNDDLKRFYTTLHDGFGFYIGFTMGPSRLEDFVRIDELCDEPIPNFPNLIGVFSSGAGDYLALEHKAAVGKAYIWWHEKQDSPDTDVDLWVVMDTWMSIFLENSESNDSMYV